MNFVESIGDIAGLGAFVGMIAALSTLVKDRMKKAEQKGAADEREKEMKSDIDGLGRKVNNVHQEVRENATKIHEQENRHTRTETMLETLAESVNKIDSKLDRLLEK